MNPESLIDPLLVAPPDEFRAILGMLSPHGPELAGLLWNRVESAAEHRDRRIRAACALAAFDPDNSAWNRIAPEVAGLLLAENPLLVNEWVAMLRPVAPVARRLRWRTSSAGPSDRGARRLATSILADYSSADPEQLVDLITNADPEQFDVLLPGVTSHREAAIPLLQEPRPRCAPESPRSSRS